MLRLGKDGWTAVISEEFTFDNVRKIATGAAVYLINNDLLTKPVIIGYDARFLSEKVAAIMVRVLETAGASLMLVDRDTPLPALEWAVKDRDAACALMVTAGAAAPQYSGLKLIPGTDLGKRDNVKDIDRNIYFGGIASIAGNPEPDNLAYLSGLARLKQSNIAKSKIERFDPRGRYFKQAAAAVDQGAIKKAKLKIVVDPMFGSGRGYLDTLLQRAGCEVEEIHNYRDVLFGGRAPEPKEENLAELKAKVAENKANLGFALSGEAGGFAVINNSGQYFPSGRFVNLKTADAILACLQIVELAARKGLKALL
jgi:phosphomannomutase